MRRTLSLAYVLLAACASRQPPAPTPPPPSPAPPVAPVAPVDAVVAADATAAPTPPDHAPQEVVHGPWRFALAMDAGMSHVEITLVLFDGSRPFGVLPLPRLINGCSTEAYARLVGQPPGADVVVAMGCVPPRGVAPASAAVAARVIRRGDQLVAQTGASRRGRVTSWQDGETLAIPSGVTPAEAPNGTFTEAQLDEARRALSPPDPNAMQDPASPSPPR